MYLRALSSWSVAFGYNEAQENPMTTVPISSVKSRLAQLLQEIEELGERVVITRSGRPVGGLIPVDEYEGLLEMLEILADPELSAAVRRGLEDVEADRLLTDEEVWGGLDDPVQP
jgi:prevent-host-death family protein